MIKILFVCTGNTCRSPMAQGLCQKYIGDHGLVGQFVCASAGIDAENGAPISENAAAVMNEIGVDMSSHQAHTVTQQMCDEADYIFTMSNTHSNLLIGMFKGVADKIKVLGNPIFDPYGQNLEFYRFCRNGLKDKVERAMNDIQRHIEEEKQKEMEDQEKAKLYGGLYGGYRV